MNGEIDSLKAKIIELSLNYHTHTKKTTTKNSEKNKQTKQNKTKKQTNSLYLFL